MYAFVVIHNLVKIANLAFDIKMMHETPHTDNGLDIAALP
jgi:hypothetical protein